MSSLGRQVGCPDGNAVDASLGSYAPYMKFWERICVVARWSALMVGVLVPAIWVVSKHWMVSVAAPGGRPMLAINDGVIVATNASWGNERWSGLHIEPALDRGWMVPPSVWFHNWSDWFIATPLWRVGAVAVLVAGVAWGLHLVRRRRDRDLCRVCRYSRTGLDIHTPCPECGVRPKPSA